MNHAMKLNRFSSKQSALFSSYFGSSLSSSVSRSGRKGADCVRFVQVASDNDPRQSKFHNMDKTSKTRDQDDNNLNVMEESFGKGYATRSDDEGFGGVYGGNDESNTEMKIIKDPAQHDSNQGSEVKEKEHSRNQKN